LSPLTKLFVGLLVVLSLLLTAATVTFVNTIDNQREKAAQARQALENQVAASQQEQAKLQAAMTQAQDAERFAQNQVEQLKQQANQSQKDIADLGVQLARANSDLAIRSADTTRLAEALKATMPNCAGVAIQAFSPSLKRILPEMGYDNA